MSFFSDLFEGNFSNLGHDLTAHIGEDLGYAALGGAAVAAPFLLPELGAAFGLGGAAADLGAGGAALGAGSDAVAAGEVGSAALGAGEAAGAAAPTTIDALLSGASAGGGAGTDALALAAPEAAAGGSEGITAINTALGIGDTGVSGGGAGVGEALTGLGKAGASAAADSPWSLSSLVGDAGKELSSLAAHPFKTALGALPLGMAAMQGQKGNANQQALQDQANQLGSQGKAFMNYLQTGTLPPGLQAAVTQATAARKAQIISNHARNGMSTDPSANTALASELAAADENALIAVAQEGQKLFDSGATEVGLSNQILQRLIAMDQQQSQNMGKAIANFASAMGTGKAA